MKPLMKILSSLFINLKELDKSEETTPSQTHIIESIGSTSTITANEIASDLKVTKGLVSQLIKELVEGGYINQDVDPIDKRMRVLSLTPKGEKVYDYHRSCHAVLEDVIETNLSIEEQKAFMKGLELLDQALKNNEN